MDTNPPIVREEIHKHIENCLTIVWNINHNAKVCPINQGYRSLFCFPLMPLYIMSFLFKIGKWHMSHISQHHNTLLNIASPSGPGLEEGEGCFCLLKAIIGPLMYFTPLGPDVLAFL